MAHMTCLPQVTGERREHPPTWPPCVALAAVLALLAPERAVAQEFGYTVAPAATSVRWGSDLGLDDGYLYGGQFSFDFERQLSLQGFYFTNSGMRTALADLELGGDLSGALVDQDVNLRLYGGNLVFRLATGSIVPYLKAGGGVLQLRPERAERRSRQIALTAGGGVSLPLFGATRLNLWAEDLAFRIDRASLGTPGDGVAPVADPEADDLRHNLVLGAGLAIPLGGASYTRPGPTQFNSWGLTGASFAVEPMVGRMFFDDAVALPALEFAGLRGGVDFGRYVGLRGFYLWGVNEDLDRTRPVRSWGGEAQFRLNSGLGITPFLLAGAGRLDFHGAFEGPEGEQPADKTSLILGAGLALPINERFALQVAARDYLFGQDRIEDVTRTSDVRHNWLVSAGLRVSLGGERGSALAARDRQALRDTRAAARDSMRVARTANDSLRARLDSLRAELAALESGADSTPQSGVDSGGAARAGAARSSATRLVGRSDSATAADAPSGYVSGRSVTLPVPTEGELYVRYGPEPREGSRVAGRPAPPAPQAADGGMALTELRAAIREVLRDELRDEPRDDRPRRAPTDLRGSAAVGGGSPPAERAAELERRLMAHVDAVVAERVARLRDSLQGVAPARLGAAAPATAGRAAPTADEALPRLDRRLLEPMDAMVEQRVREAMTSMERRLRQDIGSTERRLAEEIARVQQRLDAGGGADVDTVVVARERAGAVTSTRTAAPSTGAVGVVPLRANRIVAYSGATVGDGMQTLLGMRLGLGPVSAAIPSLRLVPEVALGFGSGTTSTMVAANLQYRFPQVRVRDLLSFEPRLSAGLGLLTFSEALDDRDGLEAVLNLGYGVAVPLAWRSDAESFGSLIVEHQGVDLFDLQRVLVGLQWGF